MPWAVSSLPLAVCCCLKRVAASLASLFMPRMLRDSLACKVKHYPSAYVQIHLRKGHLNLEAFSEKERTRSGPHTMMTWHVTCSMRSHSDLCLPAKTADTCNTRWQHIRCQDQPTGSLSKQFQTLQMCRKPSSQRPCSLSALLCAITGAHNKCSGHNLGWQCFDIRWPCEAL